MKYTDIINTVILLAILYIVFQLMKSNKVQNEMMLGIAIKTGSIHGVSKSKVKRSATENGSDYNHSEQGEGFEEKKKAGAPKSAPKKIHKQFLSLFKDGIPKTTPQIKELYTKTFKELDKTKFNNTLHYMTKMDLLGKDKAEGRQNYWGPVDWFDERGLMYEDYLEKVEKDQQTT